MASAFPKVEYEQRLTRLRRQMNDKGLSLLVVVNPANLNYLSGYDAWSYQNTQALLVPSSELEPVWIGRSLDVAAAHNTSWLSADNIVGYAESYADNSPKHAMEAVAGEINRRGWNTGRIGYEGDTFFFSLRGFFTLQKGIPEAELVDVGVLINWLRTIKTPSEIEFMRRAGKVVDKVMRVAIDSLRPGIRENDYAARIVQAQIEGDADFGASYPCMIPFIQTGTHAGISHAPWTTDVIPDGSITVLELSGCYLRYNATLARTISLGKPSDRLVRLANTVQEGHAAAMAAMKPGVTCHDVWAAWQAVLSPSGFKKHSRIGYTLGLNYTPTWREYTASLEPGKEDELREGMCFHLLCGMWTGDGTNKGDPNYGLSETVLVTKNGCETLTNFERKLFAKH
ncbi:M24 family metallopeptidase [Bradyrhizobium sp. STM 3561]|uniref:M24 family metallopeptidase n=1 Tax=Bradyrhizobium sp. STM 3561 TaxID=578923 RepID=UPI00388F9285